MKWWEWVFSGVGIVGISILAKIFLSKLFPASPATAKSSQAAVTRDSSPAAVGSNITQQINSHNIHFASSAQVPEPPEIVLGYLDEPLGLGQLCIRNLGPKPIRNVKMCDISYGEFKAEFDELPFLEDTEPNNVASLPSRNNAGRKKALVDGIYASPDVRSDDPDWFVQIPVQLELRNLSGKFIYDFVLECKPFFRHAAFKLDRSPRFLGS